MIVYFMMATLEEKLKRMECNRGKFHNDFDYEDAKDKVEEWTKTFFYNGIINEKLIGIDHAKELYEHSCVKQGIRVYPQTCTKMRDVYFDLYCDIKKYVTS
jgi:hypothetical protein